MWSTVAIYSFEQHRTELARVRSQLEATVSTLADFNELAAAAGSDTAVRASASRSAAIWRALLQYPAASIWVDTEGALSAGEPPPSAASDYLEVEDTRMHFSVHAALPWAAALADWRRSLWQNLVLCGFVSIALLVMVHFLMRARQARDAAERDALMARERSSQLSIYRTELERTVAERTSDLQVAKRSLEIELGERKAAETALREHDALLNAVTKSAAELLGASHEEAIALVLELIGQTIAVGRVQLAQFRTDSAGHLHSTVRHEWCAPGGISTVDNPALQGLDLTLHMPRSLGAAIAAGPATFFIEDVSGTYRGLFERAQMRSFLQIPVMVDAALWGSLNFIDSSERPRAWSWAESDTLKTLAGLIGVAITRARYVQELADANMIVQNSPTILYRLKGEPSLPLIYISHNITKFGHDPAQLVAAGNWPQALIDPADLPKVTAAMARVLEKNAQAATIEFRLLTGAGEHRWVENRYTPVRDKNGRLREVEGIIIDITERKAAEEKIALLARTDGLTGLANRATFVERLRQAFAASRRGAAPFAILYIDLDHFKDVNDTLGHPVGDALLREVSERLRQAARETDVIARLGGDEFAVLQTDMNEPAAAGALAEKLVRSLSAPYEIQGNQIHISASIGVCPYTAAIASPDTMLTQADLALYRSKDEGRNQYHFHSDSLDQEVLERVTLSEELRSAIERRELELFYQPQVALTSGRINGMEAQLRWHHPTRGLLAASAFIPLADKAGLTVPVGRWTIDQVCRQLALWNEQGLAPRSVSVNLSLSQLKAGAELLRDVGQSLSRWHIAPSSLEFEVTEATLVQLTLLQNDVLQQLRHLGIRIAIDDFGSEYSSFEYLRSYRVSQLKIAGAFVSAAGTDPDRAATIRAIVNLARELDVGVIAEGIDSEAQRRLFAATAAAASGQGIYFSDAVAVERADELLRQGSVGRLEADDAGTAAILLDQAG